MPIEPAGEGRWRLRWYADGTKGSPYRQKTVNGTLRTAKQELKRLQVEAEERRDTVTPEDPSFIDVSLLYVELRGPRMTPGGRERLIGYADMARLEEIVRKEIEPRGALGALLDHFGRDRRLKDFTPALVERYLLRRVSGEIGRQAKPATANRELTTLKSIFNFAAKKLRIESPIGRSVEPFKVENQAREAFFSQEDWQAFVTALDDRDRWNRYIERSRKLGPVIGNVAGFQKPRRFGGGRSPESPDSKRRLEALRATLPIFETLLGTGARLNEILGLRWRQVDLKHGRLTIHQSKTGKDVTLPLSSRLKEVFSGIPKGIGDALVFVRPDGQPYGDMEIQRAFATIRDVAGLRSELTPHTLRHTMGSWLARSGESLVTIQRILGHSSPVITARHYSHLMPTDLQDAVDRIAEMARAPKPAGGARGKK